MKSVHATIEQLDYNNVQRITIEVTREDVNDCPPCPHQATFGDDWIELAGDAYGVNDEYWTIDPESAAAYLLRAAWALAHKQQRAEQEPFDGDARPMWEKGA